MELAVYCHVIPGFFPVCTELHNILIGHCLVISGLQKIQPQKRGGKVKLRYHHICYFIFVGSSKCPPLLCKCHLILVLHLPGDVFHLVDVQVHRTRTTPIACLMMSKRNRSEILLTRLWRLAPLTGKNNLPVNVTA